MTQYKRRKDANHAEAAKWFRQLGCGLADVSNCDNFVDYVVAKHGETCSVEVKTKTGKLKKSQEDLHKTWPGEIRVVRNFEDAQEVADWLLNSALLKTGHTLEKK